MRRWHVLRTSPRHEKKVAEHLRLRGVEAWLPLVSRKRRWSDRVKVVEFPLFAGYLFARLDWPTERVAALSHPGARHFVGFRGGPATMREEELANLRILVEGARDATAEPDALFPPGREVRVCFGPLRGLVGVVARVKNRCRVYVRVPLLNQMVHAELDVMDLEPAS